MQEEVRYLGIELGTGAYVATPPETVLQRRFGDCKDKSFLLHTMLGELGVESDLALVDTYLRSSLVDYAPAPLFNHVIVRIRLDEDYWVDPTETLVGAAFSNYGPPPFGKALIIAPETQELEPIQSSGQKARTHIRYWIEAQETGKPATLSVHTEYWGRSANSFRWTYAQDTPAQYSKMCLEYYANLDASIRSLQEVRVVDSWDRNRVSTEERYELPNFWNEEEGVYLAELYPMELSGQIPSLTVGVRDHPIGLAHPLRYEQTITVDIGQPWFIDEEAERIENDHFLFEYSAGLSSSEDLQLHYVYETKADAIPPESSAETIRDFHRADELLGYVFQVDDEEIDVELESLALIGGGLALGLALGALLLAGVALRSHLVRRGVTFDESVAQVATSPPYLTVWTRPRATMRAVLNRGSLPWLIPCVAVAGVFSALDTASFRDAGDRMSLKEILLLALVAGAVGALLRLYVFGWVFSRVGRLLKGAANAREVRKAIGLVSSVELGFGLLSVPIYVFLGHDAFRSDGWETAMSDVWALVLFPVAVLQIGGVVFSFFLFLKCLAEAHRFSSWKALGTVCLSLLPLALCCGGGLAAYLVKTYPELEEETENERRERILDLLEDDMDREKLERFLEDLKTGKIEVPEAVEHLSALPSVDLGHSTIDVQRELRCGTAEVVYGEGKSTEEILDIGRTILAHHGRLLVTRLSPEKAAELVRSEPDWTYHPRSRTLTVGLPEPESGLGRVLVVSAGTSDRAVAEEAEITARWLGARTETLSDVGVAGIHRLLAHSGELRRARVLVVVAGLEGALPSVVGGLVDRPVIAVPTSVGYGASFQGVTPLLAMLNSCASGVTVVNIDNGFGAGYAASLINHLPPAG